MNKPSDEPPRLLLTIPQAAKSLGLSRSTVYALIARKQGPPVIHLGRSVRVPLDELRKWVEEQKRA